MSGEEKTEPKVRTDIRIENAIAQLIIDEYGEKIAPLVKEKIDSLLDGAFDSIVKGHVKADGATKSEFRSMIKLELEKAMKERVNKIVNETADDFTSKIKIIVED